jgi:hypothetical protein
MTNAITSTILPYQQQQVEVWRGRELMATASHVRDESVWLVKLFPKRAHYINMKLSLSGDDKELANILEAICRSYKHPKAPWDKTPRFNSTIHVPPPPRRRS